MPFSINKDTRGQSWSCEFHTRARCKLINRTIHLHLSSDLDSHSDSLLSRNDASRKTVTCDLLATAAAVAHKGTDATCLGWVHAEDGDVRR